MCDDDNWRSLGSILQDVVETALMKAMDRAETLGGLDSYAGIPAPGPAARGNEAGSEWDSGRAGEAFGKRPLICGVPANMNVKKGVTTSKTATPSLSQELGEGRKQLTVHLLDTMPSGKATVAMSRDPAPTPNAVIVVFPMDVGVHARSASR